ncbi:MAG: PilZ domain-containing protein [Candidatus Methylomirabilales bacterium]
MKKERSDRRRHSRFVVGGRASGRATATYEASVQNISLEGALIEHAHAVRPGILSHLILTLHGEEVSLRCRVVRSAVHRRELLPTGERESKYRTGLEFVEPSDETRRVISEYIQSILEDGKK